MAGRRPLTEEQKQRNNIKRQEQRLKKKLEKADGQLKELEANKLPEPEIIENIEDSDEVQKRKMEIVEKRRKALELARSKKQTPTQIRKNNEEEVMRLKQEKEEELARLKAEKEEEMMKMKEENDKLKILADEKPKTPKVKIIKKYISVPNVPKKKKNEIVPQAQQAQQAQQVPQIDYLAQQTYAEQLKMQFNKMLMNKISADTFG